MFWVQIPVDACPLFGLKRRSFLFVIDKKTKHERKSPVFRFFDRQEVDEQDFCKKNLVREPTRSVSSKGCRNAGNRYPLSATILIYKFIANYANQCHVLYYHTARNITVIQHNPYNRKTRQDNIA